MSFSEIGVSFCSTIGPSSSPSVGRKIVSPVFASPLMIGQLIDEGPRYLGSSEGWYWIVPCFGHLHEILRRELQHEGHDADVGAEPLHRGDRVGVLERGQLEDLQALFLRGDLERIGLAALLLRRAEHTRDDIAAREEGLEHRSSEVLLADDRDLHQAATFFGGAENAPALLSPATFASS